MSAEKGGDVTEIAPDDYKVEKTRWGLVPVLPGIDAEIAAALDRKIAADAAPEQVADEAA